MSSNVPQLPLRLPCPLPNLNCICTSTVRIVLFELNRLKDCVLSFRKALTVAKLKEQLAELNLPQTGVKGELIARILAAQSGSTASATAGDDFDPLVSTLDAWLRVIWDGHDVRCRTEGGSSQPTAGRELDLARTDDFGMIAVARDHYVALASWAAVLLPSGLDE